MKKKNELSLSEQLLQCLQQKIYVLDELHQIDLHLPIILIKCLHKQMKIKSTLDDDILDLMTEMLQQLTKLNVKLSTLSRKGA